MITINEWEAVSGVTLTPSQVDALASADAFALRPIASEGSWQLSATHHVGIARFGDLQINVTPKVGVHRLIELLSNSLDRFVWEDQDVLVASDDDLLSVIATSFVRRAERVLRAGVLQGYRTESDSMHTVRGRIDLGRQVSRNAGLPLPVAVTYDEYTTDIIENQIIAGAAHVLRRVGYLPPTIKTRLRRIGYQLDGVQPAPPSPSPTRVSWTRLNQPYRTVIELARMVLRTASFLASSQAGGTSDAYLVDMNKVFEDVVGTGLLQALQSNGFTVRLQHHDHLDIDRRIKIQPDVVIRRNSEVVAIADIKYKRPSLGGVSNDDLYQAIAYATRYGLNHVTLIFADPPPMQAINVGGITVALTSLDLSLSADERRAAVAEVGRALLGARAYGQELAESQLHHLAEQPNC